MKRGAQQFDVLVWTDASRVPLVHDVLAHMPAARPVAFGGPNKAPLAVLAQPWNVKTGDDLRQMLIEHPAAHLFLATGETISPADLKLIRESKTRAVTLEPLNGDDANPTATLVPHLQSCPAWLSAADPMQVVGPPRSIQLSSLCSRGSGSLHARLHEAMEMLLHLAGTPTAVHASLTGVLTEAPGDLRGITGDLTAHVKFNAGAAAVMHLSDRVPGWERRLLILGDHARLHLSDTAYRLINENEETIDSHRPASKAVDPADLIVRHWKRVLDGAAVALGPDARAVYSCCQATLLSCRTGQAESPDTLLRMRG